MRSFALRRRRLIDLAKPPADVSPRDIPVSIDAALRPETIGGVPVVITAPANGQRLTYNPAGGPGGTPAWVNAA